jgi:hypothetical protein
VPGRGVGEWPTGLAAVPRLSWFAWRLVVSYRLGGPKYTCRGGWSARVSPNGERIICVLRRAQHALPATGGQFPTLTQRHMPLQIAGISSTAKRKAE